MYLQWFSIRLLVIVVVLVPRPYVHDLATRIALKPGKGTVFFFVLSPPRVQTSRMTLFWHDGTGEYFLQLQPGGLPFKALSWCGTQIKHL